MEHPDEASVTGMPLKSPIRLLDVMSVVQFAKLGHTPAPSPAELALIAGMQYAEKGLSSPSPGPSGTDDDASPGEWSKAERKLLQSRDEALKTLDQDPEALALALSALGYVYANMNELDRALSHYLESLDVWKSRVYPNQPPLSSPTSSSPRGSPSKSKAPAGASAPAPAAADGADDPRLAEFLRDIALLYRLKGDETNAAAFEARADAAAAARK